MSRRGVPTAAELLAAVRDFLRDDVMAQTSGALRFDARVAANALAIAERELGLGAACARAHGERLARLGVADDRELAAAIRTGALDDRTAELVAVLRDSTRERLAIDSPRHLEPADLAHVPADSPARAVR